jgi:hypothetical protein
MVQGYVRFSLWWCGIRGVGWVCAWREQGTEMQKTRWRTVHRVSEETLAMQQVCLLLKGAPLGRGTELPREGADYSESML